MRNYYPEDRLSMDHRRYIDGLKIAQFIYKYFGFEDSKETLMCRNQLKKFTQKRSIFSRCVSSGYRKVFSRQNLYGLPRILFDTHFPRLEFDEIEFEERNH